MKSSVDNMRSCENSFLNSRTEIDGVVLKNVVELGLICEIKETD